MGDSGSCGVELLGADGYGCHMNHVEVADIRNVDVGVLIKSDANPASFCSVNYVQVGEIAYTNYGVKLENNGNNTSGNTIISTLVAEVQVAGFVNNDEDNTFINCRCIDMALSPAGARALINYGVCTWMGGELGGNEPNIETFVENHGTISYSYIRNWRQYSGIISVDSNDFLPILIPTNGGWYTSGTGSVYQLPTNLNMHTTNTAGSTILANTRLYLIPGDDAHYSWLRLTQKVSLSFLIERHDDSSSDVVARVQVKAADTAGDLSALGFGIEISGLDVYGEAYGSARQVTTNPIGTLTDAVTTRVEIVWNPGGRGCIEYWFNGAQTATLNGTAILDATLSDAHIVVSIYNGAQNAYASISVADLKIAVTTGYP